MPPSNAWRVFTSRSTRLRGRTAIKSPRIRRAHTLGAQEYLLFTPEADESPLQGYRHGASGTLEPWPPDAVGRLHSAVLDLTFVANGMMPQAATPDGRLLLTPEQTEEARRQAEAAQRQAEAETARLRAELERYRTGG